MKKTAILFVVLVGASFSVTAQDLPNNPEGEMPGGQPNASLPDLPQEASDAAQQVISTIQTSFQQDFEGVGDAYQNLFSNQQNQTAE